MTISKGTITGWQQIRTIEPGTAENDPKKPHIGQVPSAAGAVPERPNTTTHPRIKAVGSVRAAINVSTATQEEKRPIDNFQIY
jgi:hypothetical protein